MSKFWRITLDTNPEDCNLSCTMCEEHSEHSNFMQQLYEQTGVKRRRMPFSMLRDLMGQAAEMGVTEVIPSTMGEPLLYKQMDDFFALAKNLGLKINLTTNGTFPKKTVEEWAALIVPVTSDIKISWNGATKETSEAVMKKLNFESALENVKRFIVCRDDHFRKTGYYCRVTFQLTFMRNNMHELSDIIKLAASLGVDRVKGHHLWTHFKEIEVLNFKNSAQAINEWNIIAEEALRTVANITKPDGSQILLENVGLLDQAKLKDVPFNHECPFLGKELWVSATGNISPCCAPDEQRQTLGDFGNVNDISIGQAINSNNYQQLVQDYRTRALCKTCNMRKPC